MKRVSPAIQVSQRLASLAEPVRLRLLRLLEAEELSVGELSRVVQMPQSTVSRHLKVLADAGWLSRRSLGPATMYRLVLDDLGPEPRGLWLAVRTQMGESSEWAGDMRRLGSVLAERRLDSQAFFGRVAGEWDEVRTSLFGREFTARAMLALVNPEWTVADLGCGTGNASEILAPYVRRVIAIDQSEPMLGAARRRLSGLKNVEFIAGSLDRLPLPDAGVDAAVCLLVLHHVPEPLAALREARRILRKGGTLLVVDMLEHERAEYRQLMGHQHLGFSPGAIGEMFRRAGFAGARTIPLPGEAEAKGPGLFVATGAAE